MTDDLTKDLAEVVRQNGVDPSFEPRNCVAFLRTHHATIQQNAEAALRLRALEQSVDEHINPDTFSWMSIVRRQQELLREWAKENNHG